MPKFTKLSHDEVERLKKRRNVTQNLNEYLSFLDTVKPGDWGSLTLESGESQRAIKRRLTMAGKQKGMNLKYRRGEEGHIVFEVR
jgi:hypothetical protein